MPNSPNQNQNQKLKVEIKSRSIADHHKKKDAKIQAQFISTPNSLESDLFAKFTFFIANDSKERMGIEREMLKDLIKRHSGKFCHYYRPKNVTHVVAVEMPPSKRKFYHKKIIIKPQWLIECDKQKKIVPQFNYRIKEPQSGNFVQLTLNSQFGLNIPSPCERKEKKTSKNLGETKENCPFNIANSPVYLGAPPPVSFVEIEKMFTKHEWDKLKVYLRKNSRILPSEVFKQQLEFAQILFASKNLTLKLW
jgi:hypothetical protein